MKTRNGHKVTTANMVHTSYIRRRWFIRRITSHIKAFCGETPVFSQGCFVRNCPLYGKLCDTLAVWAVNDVCAILNFRMP